MHRHLSVKRGAHEGRFDPAHDALLVSLPKRLGEHSTRNSTIDFASRTEFRRLDNGRVDSVRRRDVAVALAARERRAEATKNVIVLDKPAGGTQVLVGVV